MAVVIETTIGDFTVDLYTEQRPQTCLNFLKLCKVKYYNWSLFHSVQSNFIAQTGDPTGTGRGGESIHGIILGEEARYYEGERMPKIKHDRSGLLSMVNCGNNMLGSQFFITLGSELQSLDGEHCVFGEVIEGLEIILKFNETIYDGDNRPYQDIRISHTVILEDPYDDPVGLVLPDRSPEPTKEVLMSDRIGADEIIDDTTGATTEEVIEMQKDKEAKARATILEIVGDLPDAEMAPPENVLFVCKLNPVTNDDDLEIIFSRFGTIIGCEVIRDRQSGDSLQYAFIEFADRKSCEEAYFKMDNVLIDDRRIHVDFSQSVAKMRWRGKGKGIRYFDEKQQRELAMINKERDRNDASSDERSRENNGKRYKDTRNDRHLKDRRSTERSPVSRESKDRKKYDRRKERNKYESDRRSGNGEREISADRRGKGGSCERSKSARKDKCEKDRKRRDEGRDRDKSSRHSRKDYRVESEERSDKYIDSAEERRDQRERSSKTEARHSDHRRKRAKEDRSEERHGRKVERKHKHKRN